MREREDFCVQLLRSECGARVGQDARVCVCVCVIVT